MENFIEKWHSNWKKFFLTLLIIKIIETANPPPKILPETDDFQTLVTNRNLYVDKSLLIEEYFKLYSQNTSALLTVQRPKGWAKTTNMKMLEKYLEIEVDDQGNPLPEEKTVNDYLFLGGPLNDLYFNPLKISESTIASPHLGQHPVILLQLKNAIGTSYDEIIHGLKSSVMETFKKHEYLSISTKITDKSRFQNYLAGEFDETGLITSIYFLSKKLYEHFGKKAHILIDDHDIPFVYSSLNSYTVDNIEIGKLLNNLLDNSISKNEFRSIVLLNGVYEADLIWDYSAYHLADSPIIEYYGFSQSEVDKLIQNSKIQVDSEKFKYWYGGYYVNGKNNYYNARSVMRCLARNGTIAYYGPIVTLDTCEIESYEYDYSTNERTNYCNQSDLATLSTGQLSLPNVHSILHVLMTSNQLKISHRVSSNISLEDRHRIHSSWSSENVKEKTILVDNGFLTLNQILLFDEEDEIVPISPIGSPITSKEINVDDLEVLRFLQFQYSEYFIPNHEIKYFYQTIALQWICHMFEIPDHDFFSLVQLILAYRINDAFNILDEYLDKPKVVSFLESEGTTSQLEFYNALMMSFELVLSSTHTIMYNDHCNVSVYGHDMIFIPTSNQSATIIITFKILDKLEKGNFQFTNIDDEQSMTPECSKELKSAVRSGMDEIETIVQTNNFNKEEHIRISLVFRGRSREIQHAAYIPISKILYFIIKGKIRLLEYFTIVSSFLVL